MITSTKYYTGDGNRGDFHEDLITTKDGTATIDTAVAFDGSGKKQPTKVSYGLYLKKNFTGLTEISGTIKIEPGKRIVKELAKVVPNVRYRVKIYA